MLSAISHTDVIEMRLGRWGRLARGRWENLGIGERSVLGRMIEEGPGAGQVSDWAAHHLPDDVVEVDGAVAKLPKRYRRAVKLHYLTEWPTEVKAADPAHLAPQFLSADQLRQAGRLRPAGGPPLSRAGSGGRSAAWLALKAWVLLTLI